MVDALLTMDKIRDIDVFSFTKEDRDIVNRILQNYDNKNYSIEFSYNTSSFSGPQIPLIILEGLNEDEKNEKLILRMPRWLGSLFVYLLAEARAQTQLEHSKLIREHLDDVLSLIGIKETVLDDGNINKV